MNQMLSRLLDLDTLRLGAEGVGLGFERPIPAWAWGGIVGASLLIALWSYSRMTGAAWARTVLALSRAALLILLVLLISGPQLVQRTEEVERDWVMVLVDRSASMSIADAAAEQQGGASRRTREAQLRDALVLHAPMWSTLASDRVVQWMGFDAGSFDLRPGDPASGPVELGSPEGQRTSLGPALDQALARAAARPLAGVVVMSDGRSISEPSRAAIRRLQAERVPVHVVPLGSDRAVGDIALRRTDAPRLAFVNDATPVRIELERVGGESGGSASALVQLVDSLTGLTLDERRVSWQGESTSLVLTSKPGEPGARAWTVRVLPEGDDLIAGNNVGEFTIEMVDRPMRVLYIDGYPRWEQRYLKNLLIREKSITCSTLILSPDRRYLQEGDVEIDALPDSLEAWAEYDAVILGDVSPDVFSGEQLAQLREHVAKRGGGLLWIGGPAATPAAWWESPLAELMPFAKDATDGTPIGEPILLRPTETASRLGLLQLGESADEPWPRELADTNVPWSTLRWAQAIDAERLKPTTEVLASASVDDLPLVMSMRYGAGRVLYVATDEIWRWRYGRGEVLPERFWLQMIRLLGRESLARAGRPAVIELSPRRTDVDQPVRVEVELLDQLLAEQKPASIAVTLRRRTADGSQPGDDAGRTVELILKPERDDGSVYSAIWLPSEAGLWIAEPTDAILAGMSLRAEALVTLPDDELRRPETNHQLLWALADETDGTVITAEELGVLPERIPNRKLRLVNEVSEPLWDTPLALLLVVFLVTFEWVGRRVLRLI